MAGRPGRGRHRLPHRRGDGRGSARERPDHRPARHEQQRDPHRLPQLRAPRAPRQGERPPRQPGDLDEPGGAGRRSLLELRRRGRPGQRPLRSRTARSWSWTTGSRGSRPTPRTDPLSAKVRRNRPPLAVDSCWIGGVQVIDADHLPDGVPLLRGAARRRRRAVHPRRDEVPAEAAEPGRLLGRVHGGAVGAAPGGVPDAASATGRSRASTRSRPCRGSRSRAARAAVRSARRPCRGEATRPTTGPNPARRPDPRSSRRCATGGRGSAPPPRAR